MAQIALAVLSAAAIAADSHMSVLEGLGIGLATTQGIRTYTNTANNRIAWGLATTQLSCLDEASRHLLWDDAWFFQLRALRGSLNNATGILAGLRARSTNEELGKRADAILSEATNAIEMSDQAIQGYAQLAPRIDRHRVLIVSSMQNSIESARDIESIVRSITSAQAVSAQANTAVDSAADAVRDAASQNTSSGAAGAAATQAADANSADLAQQMLQTELMVSDISSNIGSMTITKARKTSALGDEERLATLLDAIGLSMRRIANISPRYLKANNDVAACVPPV